MPGQKCVLLDSADGVMCLPDDEMGHGDFDVCDTIDSCAQGFHCTLSQYFVYGECPDRNAFSSIAPTASCVCRTTRWVTETSMCATPSIAAHKAFTVRSANTLY